MALPHDVLSLIYSKANARTKARLRVVDKRAAADPLMPEHFLRKGYAFGTGAHQKLYNSMDKRFDRLLQTLETTFGQCCRRTPEYRDAMAAFSIGRIAFTTSKRWYKDAVAHLDPGIGPQLATLGFVREAFPGKGVHGPHAFPDRERFMDTIVLYADKKAAIVENRIAALAAQRGVTPTNKNASRSAAAQRRRIKDGRAAEWATRVSRTYATPANRTAARVARRAARWMAAA